MNKYYVAGAAAYLARTDRMGARGHAQGYVVIDEDLEPFLSRQRDYWLAMPHALWCNAKGNVGSCNCTISHALAEINEVLK